MVGLLPLSSGGVWAIGGVFAPFAARFVLDRDLTELIVVGSLDLPKKELRVDVDLFLV